MRFYEASAVIADACALSAVEFEKLHPNPALVIEPFTAEAAKRDTTDHIPLPKPERPRPAGMHPKARITWITPEALVPAGVLPDSPAPRGIARWPALKIGRDSACDIVLPHPNISKHHATLMQVAADGSWTIEDAGSTNGTMVNDRTLVPAMPAPLLDGDIVAIGKVVIFRPYFTPARLHALLRLEGGASSISEEKLAQLELLASTLRSLGVTADIQDSALIATSVDGTTTLRVSTDASLFVVEWGENGVFLKRKTVAANDAKLQDTLRQFVLEALRYGAPATKR